MSQDMLSQMIKFSDAFTPSEKAKLYSNIETLSQ